MKITYDFAKESDIDDIMNIERSSFPAELALSRESMMERIKKIPEFFLLARNEENRAIGMIVGPSSPERYIKDELFEHTPDPDPSDKVQTILSLCVLEEYSGLGIAEQLLTNFAEVSKAHHRNLISLTCKASLISFYEAKGFVHEGVAESVFGGYTWHNITMEI